MPAPPCCLRPLPLLPHLVLPFGSAQHLQVCVEAPGLALVAEALPFPRCLGAIPQTSIEFAPAPSDVLLETVSGERRCELHCYSHLENTTSNHQQLESKSGSSTQIEEVRVSGEVPRYTCEVLRNRSGTRGRCWHGGPGDPQVFSDRDWITTSPLKPNEHKQLNKRTFEKVFLASPLQ
ncbi:uncharacterized protein LOC144613800 isoform X2 [Panthera onca]